MWAALLSLGLTKQTTHENVDKITSDQASTLTTFLVWMTDHWFTLLSPKTSSFSINSFKMYALWISGTGLRRLTFTLDADLWGNCVFFFLLFSLMNVYVLIMHVLVWTGTSWHFNWWQYGFRSMPDICSLDTFLGTPAQSHEIQYLIQNILYTHTDTHAHCCVWVCVDE